MRQPASQRRRNSFSKLAVGFLIATLLLAADAAFSQDPAKGSWRAELRKDPLYPRLYHDGKAFLALPEGQQQAMRQLQADLDKLAPAERDWLKDVLTRYVDWLDRQPDTDRQAVLGARDATARLKVVKEVREKEWVSHLPKATRQKLNKLPAAKPPVAVAAASSIGMLFGPPMDPRRFLASATAIAEMHNLREETIARLKKAESRKARDWLIAGRHWDQLTAPRAMQVRAADFGEVTELFIKEYLLPVLSAQEKERLGKAEGRWPLYPLTLVDLADKHPMALPQRNGPTTFAALPTDVKARFTGKLAGKKGDDDKKGQKKNWDTIIANKGANKKEVEARLEKIPVRNPTDAIKFATAAATYVHKKGSKMPHELWAADPKDMSPAMQAFLDQKSVFWNSLTDKEHLDLVELKGQWPEYPLRVQELAVKYGFKPPWQSLPEFPNTPKWDSYRPKSQFKTEGLLKVEVDRKATALLRRRDQEWEVVGRRQLFISAREP